ncbi:MAG: hypothetical protein A3I16_18300 [Burkholderiales bacterium RIFCSPLOWO2_02_FULL_66_35]|nr:MAG: hypothetical protein A3I16_18300 [Burkholderiales bacterium RIFCSPLOWO2_02_FULL_66_35]
MYRRRIVNYKKNHSPHEKPVIKYDQGRKVSNPNRITTNQHVIPIAHLREWLGANQLLNVFDRKVGDWSTPDLDNAFTVQRLWDQKTEVDLLGANERNYQIQVDRVKKGLPIEQHDHISAYFAMLVVRHTVAQRPRPDEPSILEDVSEPFSQEQLEQIELGNLGSPVPIVFPGGLGSQVLARITVAMSMSMEFVRHAGRFSGVRWTPVAMDADDAILPDSVARLEGRRVVLLPMSPRVVLVGSRGNSLIAAQNRYTPADINGMLLRSAERRFVVSERTCDAAPSWLLSQPPRRLR